jgi:hypothetical protein
MSTMHPNPLPLRDILAQHFSADELRSLCYDLDLDYETLPGDGQGKGARAQEIILYFKRRGRLVDLMAACCRLRPHLDLCQAPDQATLTARFHELAAAEAARTLEPIDPTRSDQHFNVGKIQAAIVNQGGTQHLSGDLTISLDFRELAPPRQPPTSPPTQASSPPSLKSPQSTPPAIATQIENTLQAINTWPQADSQAKTPLITLVAQMGGALADLPPTHTQKAEKVAARLAKVIVEATSIPSDAEMVGILGESLKRAAATLAVEAPSVLVLADRLVIAVLAVVRSLPPAGRGSQPDEPH